MLGFLASSANAQEAERDPFTPFVWEKPSNVEIINKDQYNKTPLTDKALADYRLIGVMVAPSEALALIKSKDKREFFVTTGDKIGIEGGTIHTISGEGISIDMDGKIIDLTVSNRFDTQNEND